ncbi:DNA-binding SARP family transcriptional activator [Halanaerobium saccharolyticum]|uniref:DNA-binding SARP family transcriptional activator n=1 Tax=Halanaerobium saccharolyticum TaxID=43595 RepID=A0A4R7Z5W6_9FIRM|nr:BTAD domain-containing putative transcriptional regulator [Halanaerobium saccharolyticum]RAK10623.1 DNA-binding SARP family transcriptional activator [Halanaerobium saccharolyticum]TDW06620.1 DNA-binding SARP family transcriptional activator [Halanaerobium saccharolyticum]TDX62255.1 DNA-binding SARP family transcriptional activator [Halanaerobium saccharolyticum]
MSEEEKISFYGLGPFYYQYQGKRFDGSNWISKRALYLLMYLLLAKDRNVAAEELVDVFWEESDLEDGKNKLYNTIYLLRRSLAKDGIPKDIIESVSGGYSINSSYQIWTDWEYFEKKTNQLIHGEDLAVEELEHLFQLYRGDFFHSLRYEGWTEIQREKLRENYLTLIGVLSEKLFTAQKYRDTVNYLHSGIRYDPYRENFYLLYIKALVKLGRIAEAINSYKKCEKILKEELDVLPGQKLKEEYHRIRMNQDILEDIEVDLNENPVLSSGAMFCNMEVFNKIFELEIRYVKRFKKEFVLMIIDFNNVELELSLQKITEKVGNKLRTGDVVSILNNKVYILLRDMSLVNSGIIMTRFNQFYKELGLVKKPSIDIREIN